MEWHFFLSSISAPSTQFSAHALGGIVQLWTHFLFPFRASLMCLLPFSSLSSCHPPFCNFIYQNRQARIITNKIKPAQKSLLIIWSQRHFNHKFSTIESAEECLVFEVLAPDYIVLLLTSFLIWVDTVGLVFRPVPAALPRESKVLNTKIYCHSKLIKNMETCMRALPEMLCHTLDFQFNCSWFHVP